MSYVSSVSRPMSLGDRYLVLLGGVLVGYAMIGKGFAYLGFPPFYMGEIVGLAGVVIFVWTGCFIAALTTLPSLLLAVLLIWVLLRTLPFIGVYGFDAVRDSVVVTYGGFAFIVVALLLDDARRINTVVRYYRAFLGIYVPTIPFLFAFNHYLADYIPHVPGTTVRLVWIGPSEVAVHLAGAAVFALVTFRRLPPLWTLFGSATVVMTGALTRGGMLAFGLPVVFATLVLGKWRSLVTVLVAGLAIFVAAYMVETSFTKYQEASSSVERSTSTRQVVENVLSIVGKGGEQTGGTKGWRLEWWNKIIADTVFGRYFATGRGFGINIAMADGFSNWTSRADHPPLRSPHSVHMTILARAGVPGLALWGAVLVSWLGTLMRAMWSAGRRGHTEWAGLFLFIACYVASIIINATFDTTIDGPMQGIWFWCLFGFGIGSVMVYRCQPDSGAEMMDQK
jgi:O-Antigen ligase